MTEIKLNGLTIHNIDSKETYDALVAAGLIGENDLALVKEDASGSGTDISLGLTGATVGDIVKVRAVDADGKPTEWEASGSIYHTLCSETLTESVPYVEWTTDIYGNPFDLSNIHEVLLLLKMPSKIKSSNMFFGAIGNGYAFDNGSTFSQAIVKYTLFQEQKIVYKEAIMLDGTTSYFWQGENILSRKAFIATYTNDSELQPSRIYIQQHSDTNLFPEGTLIAVLVR